MSQPPVRRPRHLIDPDNPRPASRSTRENDLRALSQVQRWVMSVLAVTTIEHLSAGLVVAAYFLEDDRPGAQAGLLGVAGFFGMVGVAVGFLIHRRSPATPWLLLGWTPAAVGAWLLWA